MKEFLEKVSSYNLFNYFLPGVLFAVIIKSISSYDFLTDNLLVTAFVLYFIGLIISRVGSLFVEPLLKYSKFLEFKNYDEFVEASKKDPKLDILSEQNNTYRSLIAMLIMVVVTKCFDLLASTIDFFNIYKEWILILLVFVLLIFSYRKQTKYIFSRIHSALNN